VIIADTILTGRLWNNPTARDLIAQLPLMLTFRDFNRVEKIAQLPRKLSMDGVPAGDDPFPRDIGYYNLSGNLVFYYDDVGYFTGIVRLGQFDGSFEVGQRDTIPIKGQECMAATLKHPHASALHAPFPGTVDTVLYTRSAVDRRNYYALHGPTETNN
jgi:hypothetical protein